MLTGIAAIILAAASLASGLQSDVSKYLASRAKAEHISAVSLSVSLSPSQPNINVTAGDATPSSLYQIGSNTKAVTAAAILQLEAEGKLTIDQTVGRWLPQYPAWRSVTIRQLLDMTSGIPTYDDMESMLHAYAVQPYKDWKASRLIAYVYPKRNGAAGWLYSNTAYLLSQLIIERAGAKSYGDALRMRFLNNPALGLSAMYYEPHVYPSGIARRLVPGYFFSNDPDNAGLQPIYGKDVRKFSLSWAQGAGGIVATPEDVTRWSRALYDGTVLKPKQQRELETLVSQKSGRPIQATTPADNRGFGLGVAQMFAPSMGRVWFYEGMTIGYRVAYVYFPKSNVVFAVGLNSQPDKKEDHIGQLLEAVYKRLHAAGKL